MNFFELFSLFDFPWDEIDQLFFCILTLAANLAIFFKLLESAWPTCASFLNKIKAEKGQKVEKSKIQVRRPSLSKKILLDQGLPKLEVINLYSPWALSWIYLDCAQVVQVGLKFRQVPRCFADGLVMWESLHKLWADLCITLAWDDWW